MDGGCLASPVVCKASTMNHIPARFRSCGIRSSSGLCFKLLLILTILPFCSQSYGSAIGISDNEIVIGQSCALTGPANQLGNQMRDGALTYFAAVNANGGIRGRKIRLITKDDGYEPKTCENNTKDLIAQDKVFLLFGYVGTPTSKAAAPIAIGHGIPFFAPLTGAEFLRNPVTRNIFTIRSSYYQETENIVQKLIQDKGFTRISVFYQNDSYGKTGLEGVKLALARRSLEVLNESSYSRNTLDVQNAVDSIMITKPEAVIIIGAYAPSSAFIQKMRDLGSQSLFCNISFVGIDALGALMSNKGIGVCATQVVPYPYDKRIPVVSEFHANLNQYQPRMEPGFVSMEGYISAKALCRILEKVPEPLTRESFIETAEKQSNVDLGGFTFGFSPDSHQGSDLVYFVQIGPGGFVTPIDSLNQLYQY